MARESGDGQPCPKRSLLASSGEARPSSMVGPSRRELSSGTYPDSSLHRPPPPRDPEHDPHLPLSGSSGHRRRLEAERRWDENRAREDV
ncbi:hypothetical protein ZWY2020_036269 [Hordeum vulgare]|nr:hypothetical protein ZWY2020_036269 [Hordeum vulgare]